jgi:hypothetical protein
MSACYGIADGSGGLTCLRFILMLCVSCISGGLLCIGGNGCAGRGLVHQGAIDLARQQSEMMFVY